MAHRTSTLVLSQHLSTAPAQKLQFQQIAAPQPLKGNYLTTPAKTSMLDFEQSDATSTCAALPPLRHVLFHKPRGVLTAKQRDATNLSLPTVTEVLITGGLAAAAELSPVGRLDAESEGLLLLTDDGWLNHCMTQPAFGCSKTYLAVARGQGHTGRRRRIRTGWCQKRMAM